MIYLPVLLIGYKCKYMCMTWQLIMTTSVGGTLLQSPSRPFSSNITFSCSLQLLALDLSSNRLTHLDVYAELPTKCASLQILNLSDNQVQRFYDHKLWKKTAKADGMQITEHVQINWLQMNNCEQSWGTGLEWWNKDDKKAPKRTHMKLSITHMLRFFLLFDPWKVHLSQRYHEIPFSAWLATVLHVLSTHTCTCSNHVTAHA